MPWLSIIMFLISFLASKSSGASTGKAAAIGAAAGLATYYVADPANPDNLLGIGLGESKATPGDPTADSGQAPPSGLLNTALSETGSTLRSWGPAGTLGVVGGATVLAGSSDFIEKYGMWLLIGGGFLLLTR